MEKELTQGTAEKHENALVVYKFFCHTKNCNRISYSIIYRPKGSDTYIGKSLEHPEISCYSDVSLEDLLLKMDYNIAEYKAHIKGWPKN